MLVNLDAKVQHTSMFVNLIHRPTTQIVFSILPLLGFIVPLSVVLIVVKLSNCRFSLFFYCQYLYLFFIFVCLSVFFSSSKSRGFTYFYLVLVAPRRQSPNFDESKDIDFLFHLIGPTPASFSFIFGLFEQRLQFLQQIYAKKCPPSIWWRGSNPWLSDVSLFP